MVKIFQPKGVRHRHLLSSKLEVDVLPGFLWIWNVESVTLLIHFYLYLLPKIPVLSHLHTQNVQALLKVFVRCVSSFSILQPILSDQGKGSSIVLSTFLSWNKRINGILVCNPWQVSLPLPLPLPSPSLAFTRNELQVFYYNTKVNKARGVGQQPGEENCPEEQMMRKWQELSHAEFLYLCDSPNECIGQ